MDLSEYDYVAISGPDARSCVVLGYRTAFETPFNPFELEAWVLSPLGNTAILEYGGPSWLTGLWRSESGTVYVTGIDGVLRTTRGISTGSPTHWQETKLGFQLYGVWGLADDCVYVWGWAPGGERMLRYDGSAWQPMPSPGNISRLRGLSPDLLYAVGYEGLVARWDGTAWTRFPVPVFSNWTGLFVESSDEVYATLELGELWEGSSYGWAMRAKGPRGLLDVAKWGGEVWVAAGKEGLFRLDGNTNLLLPVDPDLPARAFDVRNKLVVAATEAVAESDDGKQFNLTAVESLRHARETQPQLWRP